MEFSNLNTLNVFIQKNYPSIDKIKKIEILPSNKLNSIVYHIQTKNNSYVLHKITEKISYQRLEKIGNILDYLYFNNIPVPELIRNSDNKFVVKKNNVYLTKYYEGKFFSGKNNQIIDLAKNVSQLHYMLETCKIKLSSTIGNENSIITSSDLNKISNIIKQKEMKTKIDFLVMKNFSFLKDLSSNLQNIHEYLSKDTFQYQLVHGDLQPGNVLFRNDSVFVILDFNSIYYGSKLDDISFASFRFSTFFSSNIKKYQSLLNLFYKSYFQTSPIPSDLSELVKYSVAKKLLIGISKILQNYYFYNIEKWSIDLEKYLQLLKIANRLFKY